MSRIEIVEKNVLKVYQKENPSIHYILENDKKKKLREKNLKNLIFENLKFPKKMFEKANLIDIGAGTGDTAIFFNNWGADCTLMEMNKYALDRAKKIFKKISKKNTRNKFINASIFKKNLKKKYDIVTSIGVIHHTASPKIALKKISKLVRNDGYLILGVATDEGFFQRNLQRYIISLFTKLDNYEEVEKIAFKLFKENILRANKFGGRSIKAIVFDTYINPQIKGLSFFDIVRTLGKNFSYHSSAPKVNLFSNFDSPLSYKSDYFYKLKNLTNVSGLLMASNSENHLIKFKNLNKKLKNINDVHSKIIKLFSNFNQNSKINLVNFNKDIKKLNKLIKNYNILDDIFLENKKYNQELSNLSLLLNGKLNIHKFSKFIKNCKVLFKKSSGLGNNYYVFKKN